MPRYYFDVSDARTKFDDASGIVLEKLEDVSTEAESLLRLLAFEQMNNPVAKVLKTLVRNDDGRNVYRGTIVAGRGRMLFTGRRIPA